ncbi:hypothetical protein M501DRAFT_996335 [Patellaria atrata CBS 101060]|uniref:Uncharacterized protein n=1 Tax=Patellaria atrata CBS 101060 TaxID=1346257 RepID=A0A9P4VNW6_9PEZI|nr:hypothetical protein M501DRAFT_996335 [Patellaria atrata CBS 101060]
MAKSSGQDSHERGTISLSDSLKSKASSPPGNPSPEERQKAFKEAVYQVASKTNTLRTPSPLSSRASPTKMGGSSEVRVVGPNRENIPSYQKLRPVNAASPTPATPNQNRSSSITKVKSDDTSSIKSIGSTVPLFSSVNQANSNVAMVTRTATPSSPTGGNTLPIAPLSNTVAKSSALKISPDVDEAKVFQRGMGVSKYATHEPEAKVHQRGLSGSKHAPQESEADSEAWIPHGRTAFHNRISKLAESNKAQPSGEVGHNVKVEDPFKDKAVELEASERKAEKKARMEARREAITRKEADRRALLARIQAEQEELERLQQELDQDGSQNGDVQDTSEHAAAHTGQERTNHQEAFHRTEKDVDVRREDSDAVLHREEMETAVRRENERIKERQAVEEKVNLERQAVERKANAERKLAVKKANETREAAEQKANEVRQAAEDREQQARKVKQMENGIRDLLSKVESCRRTISFRDSEDEKIIAEKLDAAKEQFASGTKQVAEAKKMQEGIQNIIEVHQMKLVQAIKFEEENQAQVNEAMEHQYALEKENKARIHKTKLDLLSLDYKEDQIRKFPATTLPSHQAIEEASNENNGGRYREAVLCAPNDLSPEVTALKTEVDEQLEFLAQLNAVTDKIKDLKVDDKPTNVKSAVDKENVKLEEKHTKAEDTAKKTNVKIDEDTLTFDEWPIRQQREKEPLTTRRVKLTNIPITANLEFVQALVWGGAVERFDFTPGNTFANVFFMKSEHCDEFFKQTANGIKVPPSQTTNVVGQATGEQRVIYVDKGQDVDPMHGNLKFYIESGVTRVLRVWPIDDDWGAKALMKIAKGHGMNTRPVDKVLTGKNPNGDRVVEFRMGNIYDAINFQSQLKNDEDFEGCQYTWGPDPCAKFEGIHFGKN